MLGRWDFPSQLREGKTLQTEPPAETNEKEYTRRLTRGGNSNALVHFSYIRVLTVVYVPNLVETYNYESSISHSH